MGKSPGGRLPLEKESGAVLVEPEFGTDPDLVWVMGVLEVAFYELIFCKVVIR